MLRSINWISNLVRGARKTVVTRTKRAPLFVEVLEDRLAPAQLSFLGSSNDWSDPNNWSGGAVPTQVDDVQFDNASPVVNLNVNATGIQVHTLTLNNGFTLNVNGSLTVDNLYETAGTIAGSGTLSINNYIEWLGGRMGGSGTTTLLAGATGSIAPSVSSSTPYALIDTRTFVNAANVTWSGVFAVAAATTFRNNGSLNFFYADVTYDGATIQNFGDLNFTQGNVQFNAPATVHSLTTSDGYTLTVNADVAADVLHLTGGTLTGSATLSIANTLDWSSGSMGGTGTTSLAAGGTGNFTQAAGASAPSALTGTRTLLNFGNMTWRSNFVVDPTARLNNRGTLNFLGANFTFDSTTPISNFGTLIFGGNSAIQFNGPLTIDNNVVLDGGNYIVVGQVNVQNLRMASFGTIFGTGTDPNTVTVANSFRWEGGMLDPGVSLVIASSRTFQMVEPDGQRYMRVLHGGSLLVQGSRIPNPQANGLITVIEGGTSRTTGPFDNRGLQPSPQAAAFDAVRARGALYRAMYGGVTGLGSDKVAIFAVMEGIRSQADVNALRDAYAAMFDGSSLLADLESKLSGDDWVRAQALYNLNWNRYVAAAIHTAMFGLSFTVDTELIMRLLRDPRTLPSSVQSTYADEFQRQTGTTAMGDPLFTSANLVSDLQSKLGSDNFDQASAVLNGNSAQADAAVVHDWAGRHNAGFGVDIEPFAAFLRTRTLQQIQAMREAYSQTYGSGVANAMDTDLTNANWAIGNASSRMAEKLA